MALAGEKLWYARLETSDLSRSSSSTHRGEKSCAAARALIAHTHPFSIHLDRLLTESLVLFFSFSSKRVRRAECETEREKRAHPVVVVVVNDSELTFVLKSASSRSLPTTSRVGYKCD